MKLAGSPALDAAETMLFIPDLLNYWLTGTARSELTIASTSQSYNPQAKRWATELFDALGLPKRILAEIIQPGTSLGEHCGIPVYATAGHDTASAVAAVPAQGDNWCYISSGTWSLMGVEVDDPVVNDKARELNFTNELGAGGKVRLLKNIAGLWLLQECRRAWAAEGAEYSYEQLARMAAEAKAFSAIINPDAFLEPGDMPAKIAEHCRRTGQQPPATHAEFARTILESLGLRYRQVLESLEALLGRHLDVIHIVGGGSRNRVLNQLVADSTGRKVVAGPTEATAAGNILVQAMASGAISGLAEAREVVRNSFPLEVVEPRDRTGWGEAYERYQEVAAGCK
jgi:rhamnulokinase